MSRPSLEYLYKDNQWKYKNSSKNIMLHTSMIQREILTLTQSDNHINPYLNQKVLVILLIREMVRNAGK